MIRSFLTSKFRFQSLALLLVVVASAGAARAAEVSHFKLRDRSLIANFEDASDDGCFVSQTLIRFAESIVRQDGTVFVGPPTTQVDIEYANACTGEVLSLSGGTTTQNVAFTGDLSGASLAAVVPVTDGTNSATVTFNITFTANGDLQRAKGQFKSSDGNTTTVERFDFQVRNADVVGSVTTTLPLAAGPTPLDLARFPEGGTIGKDLNGDRVITRK